MNWEAKVLHQYSNWGPIHTDWQGCFKTLFWAKFWAKWMARFYDWFIVPTGYWEEIETGGHPTGYFFGTPCYEPRKQWTTLDFGIWWEVRKVNETNL